MILSDSLGKCAPTFSQFVGFVNFVPKCALFMLHFIKYIKSGGKCPKTIKKIYSANRRPLLFSSRPPSGLGLTEGESQLLEGRGLTREKYGLSRHHSDFACVLTSAPLFLPPPRVAVHNFSVFPRIDIYMKLQTSFNVLSFEDSVIVIAKKMNSCSR